MRIRWDPKGQRFPALKGRFVVDTYRGQMRVRAWPRKTGPSKSQAVRDQNAWFKAANHMAKRIVASQQNMAIAMTLRTGLYPRDLILRQMAGGMYDIVLPDGREIRYRRFFRETKMFQGCSVELLASVAITANVQRTIPWPLPVLDTAGFWDVASPTRFTIPAGIEIVSFTGGWKAANTGSQVREIILILKNGAVWAESDCRSWATPSTTISRGATPVIAGDYFELAVEISQGLDLPGDQRTFFTLNIEQAT